MVPILNCDKLLNKGLMYLFIYSLLFFIPYSNLLPKPCTSSFKMALKVPSFFSGLLLLSCLSLPSLISGFLSLFFITSSPPALSLPFICTQLDLCTSQARLCYAAVTNDSKISVASHKRGLYLIYIMHISIMDLLWLCSKLFSCCNPSRWRVPYLGQ